MEKREQYLIVGLGNPEADYADPRHTRGFECVRTLAERFEVKVARKRWRSLMGHAKPQGVWFVLPQTYMNLSGEGVKAAVRDTGIEPAAVWVVHDELDLPLCRLRINRGGSGAGHNGVLSVMRSLGTPEFARFRVGIGKPAVKAGARHGLGPFTKAGAAGL